MQIFVRAWKPNGWMCRGRGLVGVHLKMDPFVGRSSGWTERRSKNNKNNKKIRTKNKEDNTNNDNNESAFATQSPGNPAHKDLYASFRDSPQSVFPPKSSFTKTRIGSESRPNLDLVKQLPCL